jgi:hypothetical protein
MDLKKTRTGTITEGKIDDTFKVISVLLAQAGARAASFRDFENVWVENTGNARLYIANMDIGDPEPTDADAVPLAPGESMPFARVNTGVMYVRSEDADAANSLAFKGDPL